MKEPSHSAGNTQSAPPMAMRLRLKASVDLSPCAPTVRRIFEAMPRYALILADNGSDRMARGTMDERWYNDVLKGAFHSLAAGDCEVVQPGWRP